MTVTKWRRSSGYKKQRNYVLGAATYQDTELNQQRFRHCRILTFIIVCLRQNISIHGKRRMYAGKSTKIMMDNGWMEEPPQVYKRNKVAKIH